MDDREVAVSRPGIRQFTGPFVHAAMLCSSTDGYLAAVADFAAEAAAAHAPLHVVVPRDRLSLIRQERYLPDHAVVTEMDDLGRNPARLIPAARSMAADHPDKRLYCLWEPAWPGRSDAELREIARHETLCNLAFRGKPMTVMCLYDTDALNDDAVGYAAYTHPAIATAGQKRAGQKRRNPAYLGAGRFPPGCDDPLPWPNDANGPNDGANDGANDSANDSAAVHVMEIGERLDAVRSFSARHAYAAGLSATQVTDLLIAISELGANAHCHAGGGGVIRFWCTADELVCQVEDAGHITDPLAATHIQPIDATRGYGLWLVNKVCDLVERRTGPGGTTTRLHMRRNHT